MISVKNFRLPDDECWYPSVRPYNSNLVSNIQVGLHSSLNCGIALQICHLMISTGSDRCNHFLPISRLQNKAMVISPLNHEVSIVRASASRPIKSKRCLVMANILIIKPCNKYFFP